jgi:hypothetical protein
MDSSRPVTEPHAVIVEIVRDVEPELDPVVIADVVAATLRQRAPSNDKSRNSWRPTRSC